VGAPCLARVSGRGTALLPLAKMQAFDMITKRMGIKLFPLSVAAVFGMNLAVESATVDELLAGVGKVDISREGEGEGVDAGENPPWVKVVAISQGDTHAIIVAVDAVAIAEIGSIRDPYLANVRETVKDSLGINPKSIIINASHYYSLVAQDVEKRSIDAITTAWNTPSASESPCWDEA